MSSVEKKTAAPSLPKQPERLMPGYIPGWSIWIIWAICLILVPVLRFNIEHLDYAAVNGLTYGAAFASLIAPFIWYVWFSRFALRPRRLVFLVACGLLLFTVSCVRVASMSGGLVPRFRFVWQPMPDQTLQRPIAAARKEEQPGEHTAEATPAEQPVSMEVGFPCFLGPDRSAAVAGPKLNPDWTAHPPRLLWKAKIGAGWSAFAARDGLAVTMEQRGDEEWITCYRVENGDVVWAQSNPGRFEEVMGGIGPRSTPTIAGDKVYTLGAQGQMHCFEFRTGRVVWSQNLLDLVGVKPGEDQKGVLWGRSGSPLVNGDLVIFPAGGPAGGKCASLIALDKATGKEVWRGGEQQVGYSSPMTMTLCGVEQIVIVNEDSVSGHDPATGRELWLFKWFGSSTGMASTAQPHIVPGDRLFISKGYGGGMKLLQIARAGDAWKVEPLVEKASVMKTKFTNVAILGDYAYGLSDGILECIAWETGKAQWKKGRYAQGQLLAVGDLLLIQAESGAVALVEANPKAQRELATFRALEGKTWNNPCLYGNKLLVRNSEEAACYELAVEE